MAHKKSLRKGFVKNFHGNNNIKRQNGKLGKKDRQKVKLQS